MSEEFPIPKGKAVTIELEELGEAVGKERAASPRGSPEAWDPRLTIPVGLLNIAQR